MPLELESRIKLDDETVRSPNLCDRFSAVDLVKIGGEVHAGYLRDKTSRSKWERRTQSAMDLAMQVQRDKNFPWPGASNIAFPLITIAALQFHSRAYPAIVSGTDVAKCRVIGDDESGEKTQRAERISTHMSWQVLEEDCGWEEGQDRLLINLPIVGTVFKKSYNDAGKGYNVGEVVLAQDLVLDYWSKSVSASPRKTHIIPMFRNDLHSRMKRGTFRDVSGESWYGQPPANPSDASQAKRDNRTGMVPPQTDDTTPYKMLEQHVDFDFDGDGYAEPYIITIEETSQCVVRIVTGFDQLSDIEANSKGEIISIRRLEYFTKYEFIPSPDGGIYGVGFGFLLGPLNESTNSLINQLVDAGTMSVTGGGFLGKGAKIRGGVYTFAPLEWKRVDSTGDDLRKNIVPLEVREPSQVLFQLLSLLIQYVNRIAGTTDPMVGENPGQNTPAENMRTMIAEGSKIYSAIFKRVWRSMKEEFKLRYILNGIYMPRRKSFGRGQVALREDYLGNPDEVCPAADPNITSESMMFQQVQFLASRAASVPGYDAGAVERRLLKAMKVDAIEQVYPGVEKTGAPKDVKIQLQELKNAMAEKELEAEQFRWMTEMQEEIRMNNAEILKIQADIELTQKELQGDVADRQVAMLQSLLKAREGRNNEILSRLDVVKKQLEIRREQIKANSDSGNVRGLADASGNGGGKSGAGSKKTGTEG